ncbi:hypothetical protein NDU88_003380 [Pleurodeles waltl]|uniref:Uncharacterized protein n=1 Tax=Pleurodeles waltl TaxID=8319 RepID=A0AAV7MUF5_PLEWA|nr:hypothetical protein NDU88_003380 [Pleurodeles waltl]
MALKTRKKKHRFWRHANRKERRTATGEDSVPERNDGDDSRRRRRGGLGEPFRAEGSFWASRNLGTPTGTCVACADLKWRGSAVGEADCDAGRGACWTFPSLDASCYISPGGIKAVWGSIGQTVSFSLVADPRWHLLPEAEKNMAAPPAAIGNQ